MSHLSVRYLLASNASPSTRRPLHSLLGFISEPTQTRTQGMRTKSNRLEKLRRRPLKGRETETAPLGKIGVYSDYCTRQLNSFKQPRQPNRPSYSEHPSPDRLSPP